MTSYISRPAGTEGSGRRVFTSVAIGVATLLALSACTSSKVADFVYRDAAYRVHWLGEYMGKVFAEQRTPSGVEKQVENEARSAYGGADLWVKGESTISSGGNWITGLDYFGASADITADALITIRGQLSSGPFSTRPASVLLCVRYLGELGSKKVEVVDGFCPDGVEEQLDTYHRVTIDQIADYEVDE
ncbi:MULTISPECIES: hypothetical protein [unclassified Rathayibacter]|uniref:hypothetical protein n=1 Tax=unclassified Rathayibacter TaxID=2609250 RepID=UPI001FB334F9|nr:MULTISPECIES: hypothetical protein [unclassified Rathayibacter]MCJ1672593.1 hypothetical protein [Rathayibacter sp. VKM Ac-2929]MCJ1682071.1 hypothetical protein [Rathayibacter sp. VKM Ac-2928]MCJ1685984.1 hypothetical protein [Rathayibacter sp. VKM Ac-2927]